LPLDYTAVVDRLLLLDKILKNKVRTVYYINPIMVIVGGIMSGSGFGLNVPETSFPSLIYKSNPPKDGPLRIAVFAG
jgi:hypothetical protein